MPGPEVEAVPSQSPSVDVAPVVLGGGEIAAVVEVVLYLIRLVYFGLGTHMLNLRFHVGYDLFQGRGNRWDLSGQKKESSTSQHMVWVRGPASSSDCTP